MPRSLFAGDSISTGSIWLQLNELLPLRQYYNNHQHVQAFSDHFDQILPAHVELEKLPLPKRILDDLVDGIEKILAGELSGELEKTIAGNGLHCDFDTCGIFYNPDRI